jgi:hypothetical protein
MYLSEATSYTPDWFLTKEFDEERGFFSMSQGWMTD